MTQKEINERLEAIVDAVGPANTLSLLAGICYDKSMHINDNWQDKALANHWESKGKVIDAAATKLKGYDN